MLTSMQNQPLEKLYLNDDGVPTFLPICCKFVQKHSKTVGVFRVCGNKKLENELYILFNAPQCAIPPCAQVHDIACLIKNWLKALPTPIIIPDIYNRFYKEDDEEAVCDILKNLPEINRKVLAYVFFTIKIVLQNSEQNKMTMGNISTCFQTCLTQDSKNLNTHLPFGIFFEYAVKYLNEDGTNFVFPE